MSLLFFRTARLRCAAAAVVLCGTGLLSTASQAADAAKSAAARAAAGKPVTGQPAQELTPQILYQLMLAEIAGARGQTTLAAQAYLDLAKRTRDARIARRAAEVALIARQPELAGEAAHLWVELEPNSSLARQFAAVPLSASPAGVEEIYTTLAQALAKQGDQVGDALVGLNRALARIPDKTLVRRLIDRLTEPYLSLAEAHFARSVAAYNVGDGEAAAKEADRTLELRPNWETAVILKAQIQQRTSPDAAQRTLQAYLAAVPAAREARLALGRMQVSEKHFDDARKTFEALLSAEPDDMDVLHAVALLSLQVGDRAAAGRHFRRLLELGYAEPEVIRFYLGQIAEEDKHWDEALGWYRQVNKGELRGQARAREAVVLAHQGKLAEARKLLHEWARNDEHERSRYLIVEAQLLRDAGKPQEALAVLERGLRADGDNPDLLYESALLEESHGKMNSMEVRLRKLIALRPDHAHAYNALGYSLADRGIRLEEAEKLIGKALTLAPDDPFIMDSMGWVRYRRGDLPGALEYLQKAYGLRADPEIAAHLGEVLWKMGRHEEAAKTWHEAAAANPDNEALTKVIRKFRP
ncbi:MAG: tetratricopeptide repeat protein [Zoogloea sp.]|nr:tetratricopeptide repeat protein [Zoogloea sp.]